MKINITKKVLLYTASLLLLFSCIVSCMFSYFYTEKTLEAHKSELTQKAVKIADNVSSYLGHSRKGMMGNSNKGLGSYLNSLNQDEFNEIWVVDRNAQSITQGAMHHQVTYDDLPLGSDTMIDLAFAGEISYGEDFSELLDTKTLSVAAPVISKGEVVAVVLYHAPVLGIQAVLNSSYQIMFFSVFASLVLASLYGLWASLHLVQPIKQLNNVATQLVAGDFHVKSAIVSKDEIGALAGTLDTLALRLEEADREHIAIEKMRSDFIANISHELRTPVSIMRATLEALKDGIVQEEDVEHQVNQLLDESVHLQRLVNDLLELSSLSNSDFKIEMELIQINDVVNDCVRGAKASAMKKNCELVSNLETVPYPVLADYGRIRQMITIVLDNAIKFANESSRIMIDLKQGKKGAILTISDTGLMIDDEVLPHLFERFYKTMNQQSGTGLGLAIAKQIAERHQIEIEVSNGTLTTFTFLIPYHQE